MKICGKEWVSRERSRARCGTNTRSLLVPLAELTRATKREILKIWEFFGVIFLTVQLGSPDKVASCRAEKVTRLVSLIFSNPTPLP